MNDQLNNILSSLYQGPSNSQLMMSSRLDEVPDEDRSPLDKFLDYFKKQKTVNGFEPQWKNEQY